jgi:hypothetical protein
LSKGACGIEKRRNVGFGAIGTVNDIITNGHYYPSCGVQCGFLPTWQVSFRITYALVIAQIQIADASRVVPA